MASDGRIDYLLRCQDSWVEALGRIFSYFCFMLSLRDGVWRVYDACAC